jgi:hypothetical protein
LLKRVNLNLVVPEVVARVNAEALALVELANGLLQWLKEQVRLMVWVEWGVIQHALKVPRRRYYCLLLWRELSLPPNPIARVV